ncbi:hypothetical protein [Streptomyces sp. NBC_00827]|uniref:hypothetical protein n=1 Tax=Streptomyces sp. NBC_00827 TaxID=2903677 RepID=UPI003868836C|nr:hypothetical protein OG569_35170 [Streptomyces sp. NBC_00827]
MSEPIHYGKPVVSDPLGVTDALLPSAVWAIATRDLRHPAATPPAQVQLSPAAHRAGATASTRHSPSR